MTSKIADLDKVEKMAMRVLGAKGRVQLLNGFSSIRFQRRMTVAIMNATLATSAPISYIQDEPQLACMDELDIQLAFTGIFGLSKASSLEASSPAKSGVIIGGLDSPEARCGCRRRELLVVVSPFDV
jgi:hypothetical protein